MSRARGRGVPLGEPEAFEAATGHGVQAKVEGRRVWVGNRKLMARENVPMAEFEAVAARLADEGKTPMFVVIDGAAAGVIGVADTIRED